jgi:hypothetical protein
MSNTDIRFHNQNHPSQRNGKFLDEDTIGFLTIGAIGLGVVVTAGTVFLGVFTN